MIGEQDAAYARNWQRHADGDWGKGEPPSNPQASLRAELDGWRQRNARVYTHLVTTDERAKQIASSAGWLTSDDVASDWARIDEAEVRRKIRAVQQSAFPLLYGKFLATALRNHAPRLLGMLPPQWLDEKLDTPAHNDNVVELSIAAAPTPSEVKRGPVFEDDPP